MPETEDEPTGPLDATDLDDLLREVASRVEGVLDEKERLGLLLDAVVTLAADLTLDSVLARIVEVAGALVDARYAALGVLGGRGGPRLRTFIHHGIAADVAVEIGELPRGHGLLGQIIDRPQPLRLHDLAEHASSVGFPDHHPSMSSFLGVPVRIRDKVFGNLYLTEKMGPGDFTSQDEAIVVALAAAAGVVIENARLYEEAQRREQWLGATAEITGRIAGSLSPDDALDGLAEHARQVSGADTSWIFEVPVQVSGDGPVVPRALSGLARELKGVDLESAAEGPLVAEEQLLLSVSVRADRSLALVLGWEAGRIESFHEVDPAWLESFAEQAGLALEVAQAREASQRLAVLEDRDRIARDLHDLVIQRLFGVCLGLESTSRRTKDGEAAERLTSAVDDLDATIKDIRRTIFELGAVQAATDIQSEVTRVVDRARRALGFRPDLTFEGPVRTMIGDGVAPDLLAVLGEALSNAARHAGATSLQVVLTAGEATVLTVTDNGCGPGEGAVESGLANLRHRAEARGGSFEIGAGVDGGTRLVWSVPRT
ncbi:GAF domain-containing sensor histidine kinase [Nocardioides sp.]|uniref:GAF domain-containing sensor histidine kinase n=1 Tax=Nocardioides sp. TaxID=35761 RepID=UPI002B26CEBD|nr:GAF domain-containing protein [Nocardioides sp.]